MSRLFSNTTQALLRQRGYKGSMTVDATDNLGGVNALMLAVRNQPVKSDEDGSTVDHPPHLELAKALLEEGIDVYREDDDGESVWVYSFDVLHTAPILLNYWTDVQHLNSLDRCFLQEVINNGALGDLMEMDEETDAFLKDMVGRLSEAGFDFHHKDIDGISLFETLVGDSHLWTEDSLSAYLWEGLRTRLQDSIPEGQHKNAGPLRL